MMSIMANVLLTQQCVRACPYCFAKKLMADGVQDSVLQWDDLVFLADFFDNPVDRHMTLLGGEPTLHPHFVDFVQYLIQRNYRVAVFTSGIMSEKILRDAEASLVSARADQLSFMVNLNHPSMSSAKELERIDAFLKVFGSVTNLSLNIFSLDFTMEYLFDYIDRFQLRPHIRVGIAHPIPGEKNSCVSPQDFDKVIARLTSYVPALAERNISVGFDCGFPLCKFTDEQIGMFYKLEKGVETRSLKFVCNAALDIGPDLTVWSCFPLSKFKKRSLYEFNSVQEVIAYYSEFHKETRQTMGCGIYQECADCRLMKNERCMGGCLAHPLIKAGLSEVLV